MKPQVGKYWKKLVCKLRTMNLGLFSLSLMMENLHLVMNGMFLYFTQIVFLGLYLKTVLKVSLNGFLKAN